MSKQINIPKKWVKKIQNREEVNVHYEHGVELITLRMDDFFKLLEELQQRRNSK